jgi:hypothetical protein
LHRWNRQNNLQTFVSHISLPCAKVLNFLLGLHQFSSSNRSEDLATTSQSHLNKMLNGTAGPNDTSDLAFPSDNDSNSCSSRTIVSPNSSNTSDRNAVSSPSYHTLGRSKRDCSSPASSHTLNQSAASQASTDSDASLPMLGGSHESSTSSRSSHTIARSD